MFQGGEEDWLVGSPTEEAGENITSWLRQASTQLRHIFL